MWCSFDSPVFVIKIKVRLTEHGNHNQDVLRSIWTYPKQQFLLWLFNSFTLTLIFQTDPIRTQSDYSIDIIQTESNCTNEDEGENELMFPFMFQDIFESAWKMLSQKNIQKGCVNGSSPELKADSMQTDSNGATNTGTSFLLHQLISFTTVSLNPSTSFQVFWRRPRESSQLSINARKTGCPLQTSSMTWKI